MTEFSEVAKAGPARSRPDQAWRSLLRPTHWVKNLLLFLPPLFAHEPITLPMLGSLMLGFVCMCCAASAGYLVNDVLDAAHDRQHSWKKARPVASGLVRPQSAAVAALGLAFVAIVLAEVFLGVGAAAMVAVYLVVTIVYSLWLKMLVAADILVLAGLYVWRLAIGGEIAGVPLSSWLLALAVFLFLSLALMKRIDEVTPLRSTGGSSPGRGYVGGHWAWLISAAALFGAAALLTLGAYLLWSGAAETYYRNPAALWAAAAAFGLCLVRLGRSALQGDMGGDPVVFAASDPTCLALSVVAVAAYVLAI